MRSLATALVAALGVSALVTVGCDDHDHGAEPFATFQACYDDHHVAEALPVKEAIVICCLEHPIAGVSPVCGDDAAMCSAYLGANLSATSATPTEVSAACAEYIVQKGM